MSSKLPLKDIEFIADFAAFCRSKGDERYNFFNNCDCALAQFLRFSGRCENPYVIGLGQWKPADEHGENWRQVPFDREGTPGHERILGREPYTFSALATRLEALIADAPTVERAQ